MNLQTKQQIKKKLRLYTKLGSICIGTFLLGFATILIFLNGIPTVLRYFIGIVTIASPFVGMIFTFYSMKYQLKIKQYRNNIREYRTRVLFHKVIQLIDSNDLNTAIDLHSTIPNCYLKTFLYAYFIGVSKYSNDEDFKYRGADILNSVLDNNNPNKVEL
jgi:hypothetical protein